MLKQEDGGFWTRSDKILASMDVAMVSERCGE